MAKYEALSTLTVLPSTTIRPGETVDLNDQTAIILFRKGCIQPATIERRIENLELQEYEHGTNDE